MNLETAFGRWKLAYYEILNDLPHQRPEIVAQLIEDGCELGAVVEHADWRVLQAMLDLMTNHLYRRWRVEPAQSIAKWTRRAK